MLEFTGERVIPGQVNDDLWAEHFSRYSFARRYVNGRKTLDAGCGTGYGTAELALSASFAIGLDQAADATAFARDQFALPNLSFVTGSCTKLPFADASFECVVAFEVIEHLTDYRGFVEEAARVLGEDGLFVVSSPNKVYYNESRGETGANPFHEHEFAPDEFRLELERVFPSVSMLVQNHLRAVAFYSPDEFLPADAETSSVAGSIETSHFLVAVCGKGKAAEQRGFVYVPRASNTLREREEHIKLLERWYAQVREERNKLLGLLKEQAAQLTQRTEWGQRLTGELSGAGEKIAKLQGELKHMAEGYEAQLRRFEQELAERTTWVQKREEELAAAATALQSDLAQQTAELVRSVELLQTAENTVIERTQWAQGLEEERARLVKQLAFVRSSRWVRAGRTLGLGPSLTEG